MFPNGYERNMSTPLQIFSSPFYKQLSISSKSIFRSLFLGIKGLRQNLFTPIISIFKT